MSYLIRNFIYMLQNRSSLVLKSQTPKTYKSKKLNTANFGNFSHSDYQVFLHLVSKIGGGDSLIGLLVGGTIGALGSAKVAKQLGEQKGFEYVIKLTNNQILTVVQGLDAIFEIGAHVMILVSHDGRSRVIADNSPIQEVQAPINNPSVIIKKNR